MVKRPFYPVVQYFYNSIHYIKSFVFMELIKSAYKMAAVLQDGGDRDFLT